MTSTPFIWLRLGLCQQAEFAPFRHSINIFSLEAEDAWRYDRRSCEQTTDKVNRRGGSRSDGFRLVLHTFHRRHPKLTDFEPCDNFTFLDYIFFEVDTNAETVLWQAAGDPRANREARAGGCLNEITFDGI